MVSFWRSRPYCFSFAAGSDVSNRKGSSHRSSAGRVWRAPAARLVGSDRARAGPGLVRCLLGRLHGRHRLRQALHPDGQQGDAELAAAAGLCAGVVGYQGMPRRTARQSLAPSQMERVRILHLWDTDRHGSPTCHRCSAVVNAALQLFSDTACLMWWVQQFCPRSVSSVWALFCLRSVSSAVFVLPAQCELGRVSPLPVGSDGAVGQLWRRWPGQISPDRVSAGVQDAALLPDRQQRDGHPTRDLHQRTGTRSVQPSSVYHRYYIHITHIYRVAQKKRPQLCAGIVQKTF